jgi:hypothetical protein
MAATILRVPIPDTGTFTLKLYALGGDTLLNGSGDSITRGTNNKSHGNATVTEELIGVHEYRVTDGSDNTIVTGITEPLVDDAGTYRCYDYAGDIPTVSETQSGLATAANQVLMMGSSFATGTDSLEAIRDRGDAAWAAADSGVGAFRIEIRIKLDDGTLVPECDCVLTTSNTSPNIDIHGSAQSDANAVTRFDVDAGVYYLWRQKSGNDFDNPLTVTVDSSGNPVVTGD